MQSFPHLVQVVTSSENDHTQNYSLSKTIIFSTYNHLFKHQMKMRIKPFIGLAIKLEVEKYYLTCLLYVE